MNFSVIFFLYIIICGPWCANVYKFAKCDFEPSYKTEIIRGVGIVVPPVGWVLGWVPDTLSLIK